MIVSETIPPIVTWPMIRDHVRLSGDDEENQCSAWGLAAVEGFERETGVAAGTRTITVTYGPEDFRGGCRSCGLRLALPKGPVDPTSISLTMNGSTMPPSSYSVSKVGHVWLVRVWGMAPSCPGPTVLTYTAGHAQVPAIIRQAVLMYVENMYRNRGATSSQNQSENPFGLERVYDMFRTFKALAG